MEAGVRQAGISTLRSPHLLLVNEVMVQDVELVALHHLGRRVVRVVVRLVVLVPLVACWVV